MMKKFLFLLLLIFGVWGVRAEVQIIDGQKVICEDGVCVLVEEDEAFETNQTSVVATTVVPRLAQGYMKPAEFLRFLRNEETSGGLIPHADQAWWVILLLALLGGLAMNLTPCVLPMMPINLMIIGKSATRGALYGFGIALAYGVLGLLAAVGGLAFGEIQSSPWFNAVIAILFVFLALALLDVFYIDFSKRRPHVASQSASRVGQLALPFVMGMIAAVLAGACVAPVLIAVFLLTADLTAKGQTWAFSLPFVLGLGMGLPWPFAGAGLKILPKPGAWMKYVNKLFAFLVLGFAVWYASLAWRGWRLSNERTAKLDETSVINLSSPAEFNLANYKRPVLVDCWASWCKNCTAMERETLADPEVQKELQNFTVVRLRAEDLKALRALDGFQDIKGLPAFLVIPHSSAPQTKPGAF